VGEWLLRTSRVAKIDSQALAVYATSYATFAEAARQLMVGRSSMWSYVRGRAKPAKLVDVMVQHGWIVLKMARKFGMTARTRHLDHKYGAGRPATPDQIHSLRGTGRDRKPRKASSVPAGEWPADAVAMPVWFSSAAASEWRRLVDQLEVLELWTPLDVGPVSVMVSCYTLAGKCASVLADAQLVLPIEGSEGAVEHPASLIYRQLFEICESCWMDYGMSPFDRIKFDHVEGEQQGKPKLAVFPGEMA
jgi:P27 family predicted phage terminase small subunit